MHAKIASIFEFNLWQTLPNRGTPAENDVQHTQQQQLGNDSWHASTITLAIPLCEVIAYLLHF